MLAKFDATAMIVAVVGVDVLFLRGHAAAERLIVNIGIVATFALVYVLFLRGR